jgi:putative Mg2+ transporter-C (MgtC) family protein
MEKKYNIRRIRIKDLDNGLHHVQVLITVDFRNKTTDVYYVMSELDGVEKVDIESIS